MRSPPGPVACSTLRASGTVYQSRPVRSTTSGSATAGLAGTAVAGRVDSPLAAFLGGMVTGLVIGAGQALVSRRRLDPRWWIPATTIGMGKSSRGVELASVDDIDEAQIASWMTQAAALPGFGR